MDCYWKFYHKLRENKKLHYMLKFYSLYKTVINPQDVNESENANFPQVVGEIITYCAFFIIFCDFSPYSLT